MTTAIVHKTTLEVLKHLPGLRGNHDNYQGNYNYAMVTIDPEAPHLPQCYTLSDVSGVITNTLDLSNNGVCWHRNAKLAFLAEKVDLTLQETAWTLLSDAPISAEKKKTWAIYRNTLFNLLRDIQVEAIDTMTVPDPPYSITKAAEGIKQESVTILSDPSSNPVVTVEIPAYYIPVFIPHTKVSDTDYNSIFTFIYSGIEAEIPVEELRLCSFLEPLTTDSLTDPGFQYWVRLFDVDHNLVLGEQTYANSECEVVVLPVAQNLLLASPMTLELQVKKVEVYGIQVHVKGIQIKYRRL